MPTAKRARTVTEKTSNDEVLSRGTDALNLLNDPVFCSAIKATENAVTERWKLADTPQKRETQHAQLLAIELIVIELLTFANDGKHVRQSLELADKRAVVRGPGSSQRQGA